jgi:hypothetical protein
MGVIERGIAYKERGNDIEKKKSESNTKNTIDIYRNSPWNWWSCVHFLWLAYFLIHKTDVCKPVLARRMYLCTTAASSHAYVLR